MHSETDNVEAFSVLIEDGHPSVSRHLPTWLLETALRKNFTGIAAVLQQDKDVRAAIQMCNACSTNIGCYECAREGKCRMVPSSVRRDEYGDLPRGYKPPKWCRECVLADGSSSATKFCGACSEYICRQCVRSKNYRTCFECSSTVCLSQAGRWCGSKCDDGCGRQLCKNCIVKTVAFEEEELNLCRPCRSGMLFGPDEIRERD